METINKSGIIKNVKNDEITVEIMSCSACSSCAVKNYCNTAEAKQKEIILKSKNADKYKIGEEVVIEIDEKQALKSIIIAYVIPLILMISTIIGVISYQQDEIIGGICGIIVLIPYYFGLFLARDKLKSGFEFKISKKDAKEHG